MYILQFINTLSHKIQQILKRSNSNLCHPVKFTSDSYMSHQINICVPKNNRTKKTFAANAYFWLNTVEATL